MGGPPRDHGDRIRPPTDLVGAADNLRWNKNFGHVLTPLATLPARLAHSDCAEGAIRPGRFREVEVHG